MRISRRLTAVLLAVLVVGTAVSAPAQSTSTQIQIALNNLITGITTFTTARITAGRYLLWGTGTDAAGYGLRDNSGTLQYKASAASAWVNFSTSATLPTAASFLTRVPEADLSNETALSALATAILVNTTTTGVPTAYAGTSCTNQFPRSLSAIGAATCASVALTADVTGTLPVANGGLGIATGTSGGILGFTAAGTIGSSGALTANAIVLGGGAGATPTVLGSLGTTTTLLHGNAGGAPTFSAASLTADVSGILPTANGGTGIAYFTAAGPTVARVYTFPDAATTILTTNAAVTAAQGGIGQTSYTTGDIIYASGATTLSKLIDAATGNALISGGAGVAPSYGKIGLTTHVSGTLPVANGGTGLTGYTTGDLLVASGASTIASVADIAAGAVLVSGGVGVLPAYSATPTITSMTLGAAGTLTWTGQLIQSSTAAGKWKIINSAGTAGILWDLTTDGTALLRNKADGADGALVAGTLKPTASYLLASGHLLASVTAPTISSAFGVGATVPANNGTAAFTVNVGTGGAATTGVLALPTATTGWRCTVENTTGVAANRGDQRTVQTASSTTTVTVQNQTVSTGAALAWTASDVLTLGCVAY